MAAVNEIRVKVRLVCADCGKPWSAADPDACRCLCWFLRGNGLYVVKADGDGNDD